MPARWPLPRITYARRRVAITRRRYEKGCYAYSATKRTVAVSIYTRYRLTRSPHARGQSELGAP
jgi:hypothetical protein